MKTMFEVNLHTTESGVFSHYTVTPITILSEEANLIVALDSKGQKFRGQLNYYFNTEEDAWASAKLDTEAELENALEDLAELPLIIHNLRTFLDKLNSFEGDQCSNTTKPD